MYHFANLDRVGHGAAPGGYDRVGYGPNIVGVQSGPAIVGAAPMAGPMPGPGPMAPPVHPMHPMHPMHARRRGGGWAPMGPTWSPIGYGAYGYAASTPYPYSGFPHVVNTPPTQVREFVIGFGPTVILANSTAIFQAQPQLIFRGSRLIVPSALANNFSINDIRVGKDSQAVSANPIPAAAFSELAVGVNLGLDTATPGIIITISVSNTTAAQQTFSAALIGTSMQ
ncbi:MAG TPA: hypothetical protein VMN82_05010 [Thermoanaerobaculia bacterium]|nr:hypothetical protein [Thermoanaerobaculia bacterium]